MMKRVILLFVSSLLIISLLPNVYAENENTVCTVYFTYIGCPNCAVTDPIVLKEWTEKYENLVVIEYMWDAREVGWNHPHARLLGEYAQKYGTHAAVPQLFINKNKIKVGRLDVPTGEEDIKSMESNPCLLLNGSVPFSELSLSVLPEKPKIWVNGRILIYLGNNEWIFQWNGTEVSEDISGNKSGDEKLLKDLLFSDDIPSTLEGIKFEIVKPERAEFSGIAFPGYDLVPYVEFGNAIKLTIPKEETNITGNVINTDFTFTWIIIGVVLSVIIIGIIVYLFKKGVKIKVVK